MVFIIEQVGREMNQVQVDDIQQIQDIYIEWMDRWIDRWMDEDGNDGFERGG